MSLILLYGSAAGGAGPVDPATLSPSEHYDNTVGSGRTNGDWFSKIAGTIGWNAGGGAASLFSQTQNGLEYFETDAGGTALSGNTTPRPVVCDDVDMSYIWLFKIRATNPGSDGMFTQTGENGDVELSIDIGAGGAITYYAEDKSKNISSIAISGGDKRDNTWHIMGMSLANATNGAMSVYFDDGAVQTYTPAAWAPSHYNGALWAGDKMYGNPYCAWTGIAEVIFWRSKIITAEEFAGVRLWLIDKWGL